MKKFFKKIIGTVVEWALSYDREVLIQLDDTGRIPFKKEYSEGGQDAGVDLYVSEKTVIPASGKVLVKTNIKVHTENKNIWFMLTGRSSTFHKLGLQLQTGIIDQPYQGYLFSSVFNTTDKEITLEVGDRVCQMIPFYNIPLKFTTVTEFKPTTRGHGGFGSTGK